MIAHDDLIHGQNDKAAVAADLRCILCRTRPQCAILRIACHIRPRRDRRYEDNCHDRADWLIDLRISGEVHCDHEYDHHEQDPDHRIAERLSKGLSEGHPRRLGDRIGAILSARCLRLCRRESGESQSISPFLPPDSSSPMQDIIHAMYVQNKQPNRPQVQTLSSPQESHRAVR